MVDTATTAAEVLRAAADLPDRARTAALVAAGRRAATNESLRASLLALTASPRHEERAAAAAAVCGLHAASAGAAPLSCEAKAAALLLARDPSPAVHNLAMGPAAAAADEAEARSLAATVPRHALGVLCAALRRRGRQAVVDAAYEEAVAAGASAARCAALAKCVSVGALERRRAGWLVRQPAHVLAPLARANARWMVVELTAQADAAEGPLLPPALAAAITVVAGEILDAFPAGSPELQLALRLVEAARPRLADGVPGRLTELLTHKAPLDVAAHPELAGGNVFLGPRRWRRVRHTRGDDAVRALLAAPHMCSDVRDYRFGDLSAPLRRLVYPALAESAAADSSTNETVLKHIPEAARRVECARALFSCERLADDNDARIAATRVLPFDEAAALLAEFLEDPDVSVRSDAAAQLIGGAAYHRAGPHLTKALQLCLKHRKEQAEFQSIVLDELTRLPAVVWRPEHLPLLEELLQVPFANKDGARLGPQAVVLLMRAAVHNMDWALTKLPALVKLADAEVHELSWDADELDDAATLKYVQTCLLPRFELYLAAGGSIPAGDNNKDHTGPVSQHVFERLGAAKRRGVLADILNGLYDRCLALSSKARLWSRPGDEDEAVQQQVLRGEREDDGRSHNARGLVEWAVRGIKEQSHERFLEVAQRLLREDVRWVQMDVIRDALFTRLQGPLLSAFIEGESARLHRVPDRRLVPDWLPTCRRRRWAPNGTRVPPLSVVAGTWAAAQQRLLQDLLLWMVHAYYTEPEAHTAPAKPLIDLAARLPCAGLRDGADGGLAALTRADFEPVVLRDWALQALGTMLDAASLEELLAALGDARLREALTAAQRRVRALGAAEALRLLRPVLLRSTQPSVQKQLVTFIGDLSTDDALACVLEFVRAQGGMGTAKDDEDKASKGKKGKGPSGVEKNVAVAVARALRSYLHRPEAWELLRELAAGGREAACLALCEVPAAALNAAAAAAEEKAGEGAASAWDRYAALLLPLLQSHPKAKVRATALQRIVDTPELATPAVRGALLALGAAAFAPGTAESDGNDDEPPAAAGERHDRMLVVRAIVARCAAAEDPARVAAVLAGTKTTAGSNSLATASHVADDVVSVFDGLPSVAARGALLPLLRAYHACLCERKLGAAAVRVALRLPPQEWGAAVARTQEAGLMHVGVWLAAARAPEEYRFWAHAAELGKAHAKDAKDAAAAAAMQTEEEFTAALERATLRAHAQPLLRLLGLLAVRDHLAHSDALSDEDFNAAVRAYRQDGDPAVREAAAVIDLRRKRSRD